MVNKRIEKVVSQLAQAANLVFFSDGPITDQKLETWMKRSDDQYDQMIDVIDRIKLGQPLYHIIRAKRNLPSVGISIPAIEASARAYGSLNVTVTAETDAELIQFVQTNPNVLGILADDSDFLIFPGSFRYFSIRQIDRETLTTIEFDRIALRQFLGLNEQEMIILSTLGGNDFMQYDMVRSFHERTCGHRAEIKFPYLANYIKNNNLSMDSIHELVDHILCNVVQNYEQHAKDLIYESLNSYDTVIPGINQI